MVANPQILAGQVVASGQDSEPFHPLVTTNDGFVLADAIQSGARILPGVASYQKGVLTAQSSADYAAALAAYRAKYPDAETYDGQQAFYATNRAIAAKYDALFKELDSITDQSTPVIVSTGSGDGPYTQTINGRSTTGDGSTSKPAVVVVPVVTPPVNNAVPTRNDGVPRPPDVTFSPVAPQVILSVPVIPSHVPSTDPTSIPEDQRRALAATGTGSGGLRDTGIVPQMGNGIPWGWILAAAGGLAAAHYAGWLK